MLDPRLKLRHLQALVTVHARRSVQGGADELARTPSAVSKSLTEFEAIVGARLFERTRRGLLPTPAGERLVAQVHNSLALLGDAIDRSAGRAGAGEPAVVTLGALPTAASTLVPGAVQRFQALRPDVVVRVLAGTNIGLLDRLRQRKLDFVIGRLADASWMYDLSFEALYEEALVLVAARGHVLEQVRAPSLAAVYAHPVILPERDTVIRATLDPLLQAAELRPAPRVIETLCDAFARQFVLQGDAVWFCAPGVVAQDLASGQLVMLDYELGATRRAVGLSVRGDMPLSTAAADLAEQLRVQARRLRAGVPGR